MYENMGQTIAKLRRDRNLTQEKLAEQLAVSAQAVSKWENETCYPDIDMLPRLAHFFGVSIDTLFGYTDTRTRQIDEVIDRIDTMNRQNNGEDVNLDECIALARDAVLRYPGEERVLVALASVLYNAGYVRYGEYHLTDTDGYDILDTARHRTYAEWKEAIALYEKALRTIPAGKTSERAIRELAQLCLNPGEYDRARAVVENAPDLYGTRDLLIATATDGKARAAAYGEALLRTVQLASELMVSTVCTYRDNMAPAEKVRSLYDAVAIFDLVCTDGNCGTHHYYIARVYTLLSFYLWLDGRKDEAFDALYKASAQFDRYRSFTQNSIRAYTSPLLRLVPYESAGQRADDETPPQTEKRSLADDWPWWAVPGNGAVRAEMEADPRWQTWVDSLV